VVEIHDPYREKKTEALERTEGRPDRSLRGALVLGSLSLAAIVGLAAYIAGPLGFVLVLYSTAVLVVAGVLLNLAVLYLVAWLLRTGFGPLGSAIVKLTAFLLFSYAVGLWGIVLLPGHPFLLAAAVFLFAPIQWLVLAWLFDMEFWELLLVLLAQAAIVYGTLALADELGEWLERVGGAALPL
jgi:hypothetical protein